MQVYDTHCHIGLDGKVAPEVDHRNALAARVEAMLVVGIDAATSAAARELARLPGVRWSAGLHPNDARRLEEDWPAIERLAHEPSCAAIGETGVDLYRDTTPLDPQRRSLSRHLGLARGRDLPVVFHCRDAFAELFAVLRDEPPVRGVMHCFSGGVDEARQAVDFGLHVSFAGPLTYPKNEALRAACAAVPLDRLLVETDAPFLPPQSRRGRRNEPALVVETLQRLASVRGMTLADAAAVTWRNAVLLFG